MLKLSSHGLFALPVATKNMNGWMRNVHRISVPEIIYYVDNYVVIYVDNMFGDLRLYE